MLRAMLKRLLASLPILLASIATIAGAADDTAERIVGAALTRGGAAAFLERLTDTIGGRVTGSPQSRATSELLLATLKDAGLANVHAEEWTLESRWERGAAKGRILAPIDRPLFVQAHGWTPGTPGAIEAPLLDLGTPDGKELSVPAERLRGAVVLADFKKIGDEPGFVFRARTARKLAEAGAAALVIPTDKGDRLLDIGCFGNYPKAALPMLSVAKEDAALLRRLLAKGAVRIGLDVKNTLDMTPSRERNVIAEIPGRSLPDEVVLVGGHLDSWDTGQGAQDDGSGIAAVVEVARILKSLGLQPRRTIRFAFFSGEEQAILGSQAYVAAHPAELDRMRAVLVMDEGAEAPKGFQLHGRDDLEATVRALLAPLAALGADGLSKEASFDQDHAFFLASGVPAFTLWVEEGGYPKLHHAITDTFDKVDRRWLALDTAVMAIAAWRMADASGPVGRRLSAEDSTALLRRTGLESSYRMASRRE
jgi:Zn-dependent M28 family amino/carboxypeptidase